MESTLQSPHSTTRSRFATRSLGRWGVLILALCNVVHGCAALDDASDTRCRHVRDAATRAHCEAQSSPLDHDQHVEGGWGAGSTSPSDTTSQLRDSCPDEGLRINEIFYDPPGADRNGEAEFIEIVGPPGALLTGAQIEAISGSTGAVNQVIPLFGTLDASGLLVVGGAEVEEARAFTTRALRNGPDALRLVGCGDLTLDAVVYGGREPATDGLGRGAPGPRAPEGFSVSRCPGATDQGDNQRDFVVSRPTPGRYASMEDLVDPSACGLGDRPPREATSSDPESDGSQAPIVDGADTSADDGADDGADTSADDGADTPVGGAADVVDCTRQHDVRISEIYFDPPGRDERADEFLELVAPPGTRLDGLIVDVMRGSDGSRTMRVVLAGTVSASGRFVAGGERAGASFELLGLLPNGPNSIVVRACDDVVVDRLSYGRFTSDHVGHGFGEAAPTPGPGRSLAACPDRPRINNNATDFLPAWPTPGDENAFVDPRACAAPCPSLTGAIRIDEIGETSAGAYVELRLMRDVSSTSVDIVTPSGSLPIDIGGPRGTLVVVSVPIRPSHGATSVRVVSCEHILDEIRVTGSGAVAAGEVRFDPGVGALCRCPSRPASATRTDLSPCAPSPGVANVHYHFVDADFCADGRVCDPDLFADVRINEIYYDPPGADRAEIEFVEIVGPPGLSLRDLRMLGYDAGTDRVYMDVDLTHGQIDAAGFFVIGDTERTPGRMGLPTTIQNGPDAILLVACDTEHIIDAVGYGSWPDPSASPGWGAPTPRVAPGNTSARCPYRASVDINILDFAEATPTPGAPNTGFVDRRACGPPCTSSPHGRLVINEVLYDPPGVDDGHEFVEIAGQPGMSLDGVTLVGVAGTTGQIYLGPIDLGATMPASGYLVVGGRYIPASDIALPRTIRNGPDSLVLLDCDGLEIDAVGYGNFTPSHHFYGEWLPVPPSPGRAIGRDYFSTDSDNNNSDFMPMHTPTPGAPNDT